VKIGITCEVATFKPDSRDLLDPVNRITKQYDYKIGDPLLTISFRNLTVDPICG